MSKMQFYKKKENHDCDSLFIQLKQNSKNLFQNFNLSPTTPILPASAKTPQCLQKS